MQSQFLFSLVFLLSLTGCGSDGGSAPVPRTPLLPVAQDYDPQGERLNLRDRNYFPASLGDTWTYARRVEGQVGDGSNMDRSTSALREVTRVDNTEFDVTESTTRESETTRYARTANGITEIKPLDGIYPDSVSNFVGDLVEYPEPFFPIGSTSSSIRQGYWPEDLDGDGRTESYKIQKLRTLVAIAPFDTPYGQLEDVAQFQVTTTMSIYPSDSRYAVLVATYAESTWWAPGVGLLQANRQFTVGSETEIESLQLTAATVSGQLVYP